MAAAALAEAGVGPADLAGAGVGLRLDEATGGPHSESESEFDSTLERLEVERLFAAL